MLSTATASGVKSSLLRVPVSAATTARRKFMKVPSTALFQSTSLLYYLFSSSTRHYCSVSAWTPASTTLNNSFTSSGRGARRNMATLLGAAAASGASSAAASTSSTTTADGDTEVADGSTSPSLFDTLKISNSWLTQLSPETPDNLSKSLARERLQPDDPNQNKVKRPVLNGHYVLVDPTPLPNPRLILYSQDVAHNALKLTKEQVESDDFLQWLSGGGVAKDSPHAPSASWATPYALSIMGTRYYNNCPYGTGDGYGDGRAISIAEMLVDDDTDESYELQLKGAGTTPFCRGADGRAVLRSSIREFLASEAMHYMGVPTTRALSLVVSDTLKIMRPWYTENVQLELPSIDDPRLQRYPVEQRQQLLMQLRNQKVDPNVMQQEPAAIACRVCKSFVRVGHLDLFARRAQKKSMETATQTNSRWNTDTPEWKEMVDMIWHACYREYRAEAYEPFIEQGDVAGAAEVFLTLAGDRIATMVAHWIRVGFAQGNFNADNCLVGGYTMDYGPFGFMEEYNPLFAKWTGSGQHFGFMNQPSAGFANYNVLVESVVPVICAARKTEDFEAIVKEFMDPAAKKFQVAVDTVFRTKLGFEADQDVADDLWEQLETMMRKTRTDWTLLFRQLTYVMKEFSNLELDDYEGMVKFLEGDDSLRQGSSPFYEPLSDEVRKDWVAWMEQWRTALASINASTPAVYERMRTTNPKYILREWMLVDAYNSAARREEAELFSLYSLIQHPYDEGSAYEESKYYRRAPDDALTTGGTAFMSCSS